MQLILLVAIVTTDGQWFSNENLCFQYWRCMKAECGWDCVVVAATCGSTSSASCVRRTSWLSTWHTTPPSPPNYSRNDPQKRNSTIRLLFVLCLSFFYCTHSKLLITGCVETHHFLQMSLSQCHASKCCCAKLSLKPKMHANFERNIKLPLRISSVGQMSSQNHKISTIVCCSLFSHDLAGGFTWMQMYGKCQVITPSLPFVKSYTQDYSSCWTNCDNGILKYMLLKHG